MSDVNKTAIFTLEIDNASFNREIVDATKKISELTHEKKLYIEKQKLGIQLTDEEIITLKKLDASIAANKKIVSDNTKILQKQTEATLAQTGSQKQLMAQYEAASLELKRLGGSFIKAKDGTLQLTGANKALEAETNAVFQKLKEYDAALGKHNLNVGNYGGVLTQLKQKIQELESQRSIVTDPDEVLRLTGEMRKAQFEIDKMTGKVDAMGNRIAKNDIKDGFADATSAVGALGGALSLLSITMGDNEEAQANLQKAVIALTVAGGALNIVKAKQDILDAATLIKDKAITAGKWLLTGATNAATVASKAFQATAIGLGLAAFAALIYKAVEAFKAYRLSVDGATSAQEKLNEARNVFADKEKTAFEKRLEDFDKVRRGYEQEIELKELGGASEKEIMLEKIALANDTLALYKKMLSEVQVSGDAYRILSDRITATTFEVNKLSLEYKNLDTLKKTSETKAQAEAVEELATAFHLLNEEQKREINLAAERIGRNIMGVGNLNPEIISGTARAINDVTREQKLLNDEVNKENQLRAETLAMVEKQKQAASLLGDTIGNVFSGMLATAEEQQKEFYKSALLGLLDYLERFLTAKIAEVFISQVASKGFAGIVTAGVLTGLMKASFNVVRNSISGFAEGGVIEDSHGVPIQRSNGDNRLVTVKTGEVILNERQQSDLKAGVGADIFRRLRVPGFATGGLVLGDGGMTSRAMISKATQGIELRQAIMDAMSVMPRPIVEVTEITTLQAKVNRAEAVASIG